MAAIVVILSFVVLIATVIAVIDRFGRGGW
jgi:hypothetical protein